MAGVRRMQCVDKHKEIPRYVQNMRNKKPFMKKKSDILDGRE